jgi:16S rRNA (uracil1498-N3)-methyltransferase
MAHTDASGTDRPAYGALPRLYVDSPLAVQASVKLDPAQSNYLLNVMRLTAGGGLLVFNGRDGEWLAAVDEARRGAAVLTARHQTRPQTGGPDIHYLFAPLKRAKLDYIVQKATEMGAASLQPVMTHRTIAERVNIERMRANVIEAAEQCGVLRIPEVHEPAKLGKLLDTWDTARHLVYCDEAAPITSPLAALAAVPRGPLAVLIGPEGGFDPAERERLRSLPFVHPISLGPRIMRADTAAVAALALINAVLGDWG